LVRPEEAPPIQPTSSHSTERAPSINLGCRGQIGFPADSSIKEKREKIYRDEKQFKDLYCDQEPSARGPDMAP
jgi:hypothetical protein